MSMRSVHSVRTVRTNLSAQDSKSWRADYRRRAGIEETLNQAVNTAYDLKTCSGHAAVTGAAPVVPGSGTGAYTGISGALGLTVTGNEVDAKPGGRPFSGSALLAQSIVISGPGTVFIP